MHPLVRFRPVCFCVLARQVAVQRDSPPHPYPEPTIQQEMPCPWMDVRHQEERTVLGAASHLEKRMRTKLGEVEDGTRGSSASAYSRTRTVVRWAAEVLDGFAPAVVEKARWWETRMVEVLSVRSLPQRELAELDAAGKAVPLWKFQRMWRAVTGRPAPSAGCGGDTKSEPAVSAPSRGYGELHSTTWMLLLKSGRTTSPLVSLLSQLRAPFSIHGTPLRMNAPG
jgi:hypothetical protein